MMTQREREAAANVLRAIAHPVRLGVLEILAGGERTVSQLYRDLNCSQSMMSRQLERLETQGLISTRKVGATKYCSLRNPGITNLFGCMQAHLHDYLRLQIEDAPAR